MHVPPPSAAQAAIVGAVVGIGLKSLVECIRLQTLGRTGLQQLQLDCHYLRPLLLQGMSGREQQVRSARSSRAGLQAAVAQLVRLCTLHCPS